MTLALAAAEISLGARRFKMGYVTLTTALLSVIHPPYAGTWYTRSFVLCGQGSSLLWTPALRPYSGPVRLPRERKGIGRCVRCMLATCRVKERLSRSEQLVGYFYSAPLLDVAYCLTQPWLALCITPASGQPSLLASTHAGAAGRLALLDQVACNGHSL